MQKDNKKPCKGANSRACSKRRRRLLRANIVAAFALGAAVLGAANWGASMLAVKWRFAGAPALSQRSAEFFAAAAGAVKVSAVFNNSHPFRREAFDLLDAFADAAEGNPGLSVAARKLDPGLDLAECAELFRRTGAEPNSFVVEAGGRAAVVGEGDFTAYAAALSDGPDFFAGEGACVSAMISLLRTARPRVYFTEGRGELDPGDENGVAGASAIASALELNGYAVRKFDPGLRAVPGDCDALVVAGPRSKFAAHAVEAVRAYMSRGGSVFLMFDEPSAGGFAAELGRLGVVVGREPLEDGPARAEAEGEAAHPAVAPLRNMSLFFASPLPLSVSGSGAAAAGAAARARTLASAQEGGGALAVAVERPSYGEGVRSAESKAVICGDSAFIANASIVNGLGGNAVFFLSCVNWLASQRDLPSHPAPEAAGGRGRFNSGVDGDAAWRALALRSALCYPALILAFGLLVYVPWSRRS